MKQILKAKQEDSKKTSEYESKTCNNCVHYKECVEQHIACDGSAWKQARNDRLREFNFQDIGTTTYDATKISYISKDYRGITIDGHLLYMGYGYDYAELIEWWKYWILM